MCSKLQMLVSYTERQKALNKTKPLNKWCLLALYVGKVNLKVELFSQI